MELKENFDQNIIVRFLMGEASQADITLLNEWVKSDPANRAHFDQIRDTWNSIEFGSKLKDRDIQDDLRNVLGRIEKPTLRVSHKKRRFSHSRLWMAAAVFIIGFAVSWFVFQSPGLIQDAQIAWHIVETPKGSKTKIILPDGSKIWLNAGSKLKYPKEFAPHSREVYLEGEAFFEVAKDDHKQFLVKTHDIIVKVFGTRFNVKSYPEDNTVETTLVEGSISILKSSPEGKISGKEIKLEPNERIVLYKGSQNITPPEIKKEKIKKLPEIQPKLVLSKSIDPSRYISWKSGRLIFRSEPMEKLAVTLERRYDVRIHFVDEEIKKYKFTGTIENETIEQVMAAIRLASSIDYKIEERDIWIGRAGVKIMDEKMEPEGTAMQSGSKDFSQVMKAIDDNNRNLN